MSDASAKLAILRASLAKAGLATSQKQARIALGHTDADRCLKGGLQCAALHEVFAVSGHEAAATGFAAGLAARIGKHVLWIRTDFSALEYGEVSATGLLDLGLAPSCVLLLRVSDAEDALRAASDALCCTALGTVVIEIPREPGILDLVASRRLTLTCAESGVTALLLRFAALPEASAAETRWSVRAACSSRDWGQEEEHWGRPVFEAQLLRNRHGPTGHWVMEWNADDGVFGKSSHATNSGAVVSAPCHGPLAAAVEGGGESFRSVA